MGEPTNLQVRGPALIVAVAVTGVLLGAALWAASVDLASEVGRNAVPLDILATLFKVLSVAGLLVLARRTGSKAMRLIALLLGLMVVGSLLVDTTWFNDAMHVITEWLEGFLPVSSGFIELAAIFVALAFVAGYLVVAALRAARPEEKRSVVTLIILLLAVGVFVGPVNAVAAAGINREWLFAEDFGQVVSLAVVTGYVAGLVVAAHRSVRLA